METESMAMAARRCAGWSAWGAARSGARAMATGGSTIAAIDMLKKSGAGEIVVICIVTCDEGLSLVEEAHPDVPIYTASIDEKLDDNKYIVPGLGDAGDKIFGTK